MIISATRLVLSSHAASGTVKKVIEINPYLLGTMAGGAGVSLYSSWEVWWAESVYSRLSVLGDVPWHPVSIARVEESGTDICRSRFQIPQQPRLRL
jgi:hypothetical protein